MFCQHIFTTKTLQTTFAKLFFVFILCLMKRKSVKIFDIHIMWLFFINYKQQSHRAFKFLIWKENWKSQFVFITKHVNANVVFYFDIAKVFFSHRKINFIIIMIINKYLSSHVILSVCMFTGLICLTWHQRKHFWSLF